MCKIGAPRRQVTAILGMEILILLGAGVMIALALTLVARQYGGLLLQWAVGPAHLSGGRVKVGSGWVKAHRRHFEQSQKSQFIMKNRLTFPFLLLLSVLSNAPLSAQDVNYWSHQYGAYSILLGGTVIGSVSDLASTYYNPGRLILSDTSTFLITANAYQLSTLRVEDAAGEDQDAVNSKVGVAPNLVAGNLPWQNFIRPSRMAYSVIQRYGSEFELIARNGGTIDALPGVGGEELLAGELDYHFRVNDLWPGLTWSTLFGERIGFGLTQYFSIRSMRWDRRILYEGILEDGRTASAFQFNNFQYTLISALWKIGLSYEFTNRSNIGINITTPYLNLFGDGEVLFNETVTGGDLTGDGQSNDVLIANQQVKQKARFNSSWAFGLGASFPISNSGRLHLTAEYFAPVAAFDLLETQPFTGQTDGVSREHAVQTKADGVLNYGLGIEFAGKKKADFYASVTSDHSPAPEDVTESITAELGINRIHFSGGSVLSFRKVDLNLGLVYSTGSRDVPELSEGFLPPGWTVDAADVNRMMRSSRIKLVFGITVK